MKMNKKTMRSKLMANTAILVAMIAGALSIVSCDNDDDDGDDVDLEVAYVSLYQGSPDAPGLDIRVDSRTINTYSFDYTEYTGYLRFHTGERTLAFGPYNASNVVADTTVNLEDGNAYSIFLSGEYPDIEALFFSDNVEDPAEDQAMIRLINLSPDISEVDFGTEDETDPLFDNQTYQAAPEFMEIEADTYDFEVLSSAGDSVLLDVPDVRLAEGYFYTVVVRGYQTPPAGTTQDLSAQIIVN